MIGRNAKGEVIFASHVSGDKLRRLSSPSGNDAERGRRLIGHLVIVCGMGVDANRLKEAEAAATAAFVELRKVCADIARNACLVPPDGGSPTEEERLVAETASQRILRDRG